ncbi:protein N-terminal methyltransferase, partial [Lecanoromycetidae sp. Uapishka_2]
MASAPDASISTSDSLKYWNSISTTVDGMLGGYPEISRIDLKGSANFLAKLRREHPSPAQGSLRRGVDCGAGIGRVTAGFLSTVCDVVDVVEPVEKFAKEVKGVKMAGKGEVGKVHVVGLEAWEPEERYDLVWNQWCLGHLTDRQLVSYLERCKKVVTEDGWIIIKENMSTNVDGEDVFDETDSSVTRTNEKFKQLFREAGINCVKTELQRGFPKELLPVRFYALKP